MTFAQQIENVPPKLTSQGFRLHPSESIWYRWQETEGVKDPHWQMVRLPDGTKVSRPVHEIAKGVVVYAHAGWGDGLAPSCEMVKIWPFWWRSVCNQLEVVSITPDALRWIGYRSYGGMVNETRPPPYWIGPVIPPADIS